MSTGWGAPISGGWCLPEFLGVLPSIPLARREKSWLLGWEDKFSDALDSTLPSRKSLTCSMVLLLKRAASSLKGSGWDWLSWLSDQWLVGVVDSKFENGGRSNFGCNAPSNEDEDYMRGMVVGTVACTISASIDSDALTMLSMLLEYGFPSKRVGLFVRSGLCLGATIILPQWWNVCRCWGSN